MLRGLFGTNSIDEQNKCQADEKKQQALCYLSKLSSDLKLLTLLSKQYYKNLELNYPQFLISIDQNLLTKCKLQLTQIKHLQKAIIAQQQVYSDAALAYQNQRTQSSALARKLHKKDFAELDATYIVKLQIYQRENDKLAVQCDTQAKNLLEINNQIQTAVGLAAIKFTANKCLPLRRKIDLFKIVTQKLADTLAATPDPESALLSDMPEQTDDEIFDDFSKVIELPALVEALNQLSAKHFMEEKRALVPDLTTVETEIETFRSELASLDIKLYYSPEIMRISHKKQQEEKCAEGEQDKHLKKIKHFISVRDKMLNQATNPQDPVLEIIRFLDEPEDLIALRAGIDLAEKQLNNIFSVAEKSIYHKFDRNIQEDNLQILAEHPVLSLKKSITSIEEAIIIVDQATQKISFKVDIISICKNNIEFSRNNRKRLQEEIKLLELQFAHLHDKLTHHIPYLQQWEKDFRDIVKQIEELNDPASYFETHYAQIVEIKQRLQSDELLANIRKYIKESVFNALLELKKNRVVVSKPCEELEVVINNIVHVLPEMPPGTLPLTTLTMPAKNWIISADNAMSHLFRWQEQLIKAETLNELVDLEAVAIKAIKEQNLMPVHTIKNNLKKEQRYYSIIADILKNPQTIYTIFELESCTAEEIRNITQEVFAILINKLPVSLKSSNILETILEVVEKRDRHLHVCVPAPEAKYADEGNRQFALSNAVIEFVKKNSKDVCQYMHSYNKLLSQGDYRGSLNNYLHYLDKGIVKELSQYPEYSALMESIKSLHDLKEFFKSWCKSISLHNPLILEYYSESFKSLDSLYALFRDFAYGRKARPALSGEAKDWFNAVIARITELETCLGYLDQQQHAYQQNKNRLFYSPATQKVQAFNQLDKLIKHSLFTKGDYKMKEVAQEWEQEYSPILDHHRLRSLIYMFKWLYHALGQLIFNSPRAKPKSRVIVEEITQVTLTALPLQAG